MLIPLVLSFLASLAAAVMAYGTDARWGQHGQRGLGLIMTARRLQWPLIALSLVLCLALLGLVISGKRRAWWLIGLAPVLALFGHRFLTGTVNRYDVVDQPAFVSAAAPEGTFVGDDDHVVGVVFNDVAYAYPYACLYETPVVVQSDRDRRLLLLWSWRANAATALLVASELKARDLDITSEPADSLLVYNARRGEFIVGVTGKTPTGGAPAGVKSRIAVVKTTWKRWKQQQPDTRVMLPRDGSYGGMTRAIVTRADEPLVVLVGGDPAIALSPRDVTTLPMNVSVGGVGGAGGGGEGGAALLVFRDATTGRVRAFDRHVEADLVPQFSRNTRPKRKGLFTDADTDSGWTAEGVAIDGPAKGKKLAPVEVQEDVGEHAARYWYPGLNLYRPPAGTPPQPGR